MTEEEKLEFYKEMGEKVFNLKIKTLFEEPCPLYEPEDDGLDVIY